jgi:uncharacterized protein (TIGR02646 family)
MRPVERGLAPKIYAKYGDAVEDLKSRLGSYCSYCERQVSASLAVEHVIPKNLYPELEREWNNFLLGCTNCNSVKSDREVIIQNFLWPDRDNTLLPLVYAKGGFVRLVDNLDNEQKTKAQALLDLVGLQRHPGLIKPAQKDKRWQDREESWATAEKCKDYFDKLEQADAARDLVLEVAKSKGFFSVWMTVFNNYPNLKKELIKLFPGTAISCFDPDGKLIERPNSMI